MATTITVLSQKGGTGKTTAVRSLADVLVRVGARVLCVDADPQGNLSDYFEIDPRAHPTLGEVLTGRAAPAEAIHDDVLPANLGLAEAELVLAGKLGRELTLRKALREVEADYEFVLIDCPPTLGLLTVNAVVACDYALLTTEAQYFSLQGVEQALEVVELARENLNPQLALLGVVLNIADMRTAHSRNTQETLREHFGEAVFGTVIRQSIAYAESAERAVPILDYRPDRGVDYVDLAVEVLERLAMPELRERAEALRQELVQKRWQSQTRAPTSDVVPTPAPEPAPWESDDAGPGDRSSSPEPQSVPAE